jgi:hypothetical protein
MAEAVEQEAPAAATLFAHSIVSIVMDLFDYEQLRDAAAALQHVWLHSDKTPASALTSDVLLKVLDPDKMELEVNKTDPVKLAQAARRANWALRVIDQLYYQHASGRGKLHPALCSWTNCVLKKRSSQLAPRARAT